MSIRLVFFLFSIILLIFLIFQKLFRKWKKALLVIGALVLVIFSGSLFLFPLNSPPAPTGNMVCKTDKVFYRYEPDDTALSTHGKEREIPVTVWYPENAVPKRQPLVIYSPGSFGGGEGNMTMAMELASRGYVVMGLDHPYHTYESVMSDGKKISMDFGFIRSVMASQGSGDVESTLVSLKEWTGVRIDDISCVLDKVLDADADNDYEKLVDKERIVLTGHSLGGSGALAVGRQRPLDIRSLVILESPFAGDMVGTKGDRFVFTDKEYPLPILHIYSDSAYGMVLEGVTTYEMNLRLLKSENPKFVNKHIEGVGHLGLTDLILVTPPLTNMLDGGLDKRRPPETLQEINGYVLEFLEEYNR